ncbi:MAG TPA: hydrogenase nickel incorporation protein HypB [Gammaproteobacteria bacterium]|nr:hydrogenase nickel incorporation protein HypB [Gammaproteobacteria bacterium]
MCGICGCSSNELHHDTNHSHNHHHELNQVLIEQDILAANNALAVSNRNYLQQQNILTFNVMSSPGAGKTTLLTKTIADLKNTLPFYVIVGDQQTDHDAKRFTELNIPARQINTGKSCHLDAHSIHHALDEFNLPSSSILFIENVGNLVCPALFDLGEAYKIIILSVTEGTDKPLKYPYMFHHADAVILSKIDLLPYVDFDLKQCCEFIKQINPKTQIISVSTKTEENLVNWYQWLKETWDTQEHAAKNTNTN